MRTIDVDKLCVDLMERWDIADKQKEELIRQVMADIVTPIVVSQPTVEPERKKGKWIIISDGTFKMVKCDQCGRIMDDRDNFCPRCGLDMTDS